MRLPLPPAPVAPGRLRPLASALLAAALGVATVGTAYAQAQARPAAPGTSQFRSGVYRWTDDRGNVHYDDQNLLGDRITRSTLNSREIAPEPTLKVPEEFVAEIKARCTDFNERAQSYRRAGSVHGRDPFGNSYQLSPAQAALARTDADRLKTRFCRADAPRLILVEERAARRAAQLKKARAQEGAGVVGRSTSINSGFATTEDGVGAMSEGGATGARRSRGERIGIASN